MLTPAKLQKLNSITKCPSILTYHNLGQKGSMVDSLVEDKHFDERSVYITEELVGSKDIVKLRDYLVRMGRVDSCTIVVH